MVSQDEHVSGIESESNNEYLLDIWDFDVELKDKISSMKKTSYDEFLSKLCDDKQPKK